MSEWKAGSAGASKRPWFVYKDEQFKRTFCTVKGRTIKFANFTGADDKANELNKLERK